MINRIRTLLQDLSQKDVAQKASSDKAEMAAAALLVEAAFMDGQMDTDERTVIAGLLSERFGLADGDAQALVAEAEEVVREAGQILPFTRAIKDHFGHEERVGMIEMLWEVVYADGRLHDYESNLVRRIGGLIYVPDQEGGAARKRAMAKLGLSDGPVA